jgi:hypothetical protein
MPSETLSRTASSPATNGAAWQALLSPATWEGIPGVDEVTDPRYDPDGRLTGFDFTTRVGSKWYRGHATRSAVVDGQFLEWDVQTPELNGSVAVGIRAEADGTQVTVTLTFTSVGLMSSVLFPMIVTSIRSDFPKAVERFARELGAS